MHNMAAKKVFQRPGLKLVFLLACMAAPNALAAPHVKTYNDGEIQFYLATEFLYGNGTFDGDGRSKSLNSGSDYLYLLQNPFGVRYSFTDSWAANLEGQFAYAESKSSDATYRATRSNSLFNQIRLATDFLLFENPIEIIPELELIVPLEKIDPDKDIVPTSEGVMQTTAALRAQQKFGSFVTFGRLGFTFRGEGRSNLLPYSLAGAFDTGSTLVGLDLTGFQSMSNDKDKNNQAAREDFPVRTMAGVKRFYGVNPNMLDATAFANFTISPKFSFDINAGYILMGTNYAQGIHVGTVLTFSFDPKASKAAPRVLPPPPPPALSDEGAVEHFSEEVKDGVDQKIFKAEPTPAPKLVPPAKLKRKGPSSRRKNVSAPSQNLGKKRTLKLNSKPDSELQQSLDETEMKIELKKKKR